MAAEMIAADAVSYRIGGEAPAGRLHALLPVLLGLTAPIMVYLLIDPRALASASVLLNVYLGAIFVLATAAYIITVFESGEVTRIDISKKDRVISIERTGLLATKTVVVPFEDVASVRIETRYDDDGYKSNVPLLVMSNRQIVQLPAFTTEADVEAVRRVLGRSA